MEGHWRATCNYAYNLINSNKDDGINELAYCCDYCNGVEECSSETPSNLKKNLRMKLTLKKRNKEVHSTRAYFPIFYLISTW